MLLQGGKLPCTLHARRGAPQVLLHMRSAFPLNCCCRHGKHLLSSEYCHRHARPFLLLSTAAAPRCSSAAQPLTCN